MRGSRSIPYLLAEVQARIDNMIDRGLHIVVGDSEKGVDSRIVSYLYERRYPNVSIYSIHSTCRIRQLLPSWSVEKIHPDNPVKTDKDGHVTNRRMLETSKDRAMCRLCDVALVIWQDTYFNSRFGQRSISTGSLRNMIQLLNNGKPVTMYHKTADGLDGDCFAHHQFRSIGELEEFIQGLDAAVHKRYSKLLKDERKFAEVPALAEQPRLDF